MMAPAAWSITRKALWLVTLLLTLVISAVTVMRYFAPGHVAPEQLLANSYAYPFLFVHAGSGMIALLMGPLQFVPKIRERVPRLHRLSGRIYAAACAIGAPAGFLLALGTTAGPVAGVGFAILAVLWALFTVVGIKAAIGGRFDDHRRWMIRSYAMTASAITLRLMMPFAAIVLAAPMLLSYQIIAWACWITNLVVAELYLLRKPLPATLAPAVATA